MTDHCENAVGVFRGGWSVRMTISTLELLCQIEAADILLDLSQFRFVLLYQGFSDISCDWNPFELHQCSSLCAADVMLVDIQQVLLFQKIVLHIMVQTVVLRVYAVV